MTNAGQLVPCEEIFDEISQPSVEEIKDYATKIGIDPDSEPQLLSLAAEGLMKPLPPGWKPFYDDKRKCYYYFNKELNKTQWEHPLDEIYRDLVVKVRTESQSLSMGEPTEDATYARDDIPSFEESLPIHIQLSTQTKNTKLSPLRSKPKLGEIGSRFSDAGVKVLPKNDTKLFRQKSEERPNRKVGLTLFDSFEDRLGSKKKETEKAELTLTGGGTMFLKSNTKKTDNSPVSGNKCDIHMNGNEVNKKKILKDIDQGTEYDKFSEYDLIMNLDKDNERNTSKMKVVLTPKISDKKDNAKKEETEVKGNIKGNQVISNLKVIKPDPSDFVKPEELNAKVENVATTLLSPESEEEKEKADSTSSSEDHLNIDKIEHEKTKIEGNMKLKNTMKEENLKKQIEIKNVLDLDKREITKYRDEVLKNQKTEMEKILVEEKRKYEEKIRNELETLRKEMEHRSSGALKEEKKKLEIKFEQQKKQLQENFKIEEFKLEQSFQEKIEQTRKKLEEDYKAKALELEKQFEKKLEENKDNIIKSHTACLDEIRQKNLNEITQFNKEQQSQKDQIPINTNNLLQESEKNEHVKKYEKLVNEKRLLEDKYKCLKEKYIKLKTDVKISIEKRNKRREQSLTTTTGSETEKSPSVRKNSHSPSFHRKHSPKQLRLAAQYENNSNKKHKLEERTRSLIIQDVDTSTSERSIKSENHGVKSEQLDGDSSDVEVKTGRGRKKLLTRLKSSSLTRVSSGSSKPKEARSNSPVENLRKQLQKLEDLEDQFPQNSQGDTYHLRYPFSDGQKFEGSSELEFFRHRIHLERDSIKRAKESLRKQESHFKQKQSEVKLKHGASARQTLQQLCQEEKELTDMEVSLHRTRSLLGEKVIRLRHLQQSLQRATVPNSNQKQDDATLSDLSSHSASSGISSIEFIGAESPCQAKTSQFKESSEIIQSLENLNSEIREIWEVLNKQQQIGSIATVMTPIPLVYPDLGWPILSGIGAPVPPSIPTLADRLQSYRQHISLANAQSTMVTHDTQGATTTLVEKTRNLRQWLRQNSLDPSLEASTHQATL